MGQLQGLDQPRRKESHRNKEGRENREHRNNFPSGMGKKSSSTSQLSATGRSATNFMLVFMS